MSTPFPADSTATAPWSAPDPDAYFRFPEVKARTGLSRTTIHRLIKAGDFPAPKSLGVRAVGWKVSAIKDWCASRPDAREQATA